MTNKEFTDNRRPLGTEDGIVEVRREEAQLKAEALHNAIFNSANFSCRSGFSLF